MVAMKTPRNGGRAEIAGLLHEARALKQMSHPGIVRLHGDGTWDGMPWLALELLEGRTLLDELEALWELSPAGQVGSETRRRRSEELPTVPGRLLAPGMVYSPALRTGRPPAAAGRLSEVAFIVVQLAMILDHVHARGLVHRDVKPANVFLGAGAGAIRRVTLLDFGLACRASVPRPAHAGESLCVGTMQYAAPEQILGEPVDARTDVYSLGCVLYELVTGRRPFEGDSSHDVAQKHLHREPVRPSDLVTNLPWQLEDLVMEMLAKKPADRPATAGAAGARLARAVRGIA
jgi:serine/threonine protein kinase